MAEEKVKVKKSRLRGDSKTQRNIKIMDDVRSGMGTGVIAKKYGVSASMISQIKKANSPVMPKLKTEEAQVADQTAIEMSAIQSETREKIDE